MKVYMIRRVDTAYYYFEGSYCDTPWVIQIDGTQWTSIERIHKIIAQIKEPVEIVAFDLIEVHND